MRPMIDDLQLPQVQEIETKDRRALAEHKLPGMDGSVLQNLGRRSTWIELFGVASGPDAQAFVEKLDGKFRAGNPVAFTADIVADAEIQQVLIDDLSVQDLAGKPERFSYLVTLREHVEPVAPEDTSGLDADILDEARGLVEDVLGGITNGLGFVTGLEPFVGSLGDLLGRLRQFRDDIDAARGG
jgi:hypothetical protein